MEEISDEEYNVIQDFKLNISECDKEENESCDNYEYYAGKTLTEAVQTLSTAKKLIISAQNTYGK